MVYVYPNMHQLRLQKGPARWVDAVLMSLFSTAMMSRILMPKRERDQESDSDRGKKRETRADCFLRSELCYIRMTWLLKVDVDGQVSIKVVQLLRVFRILLHHASETLSVPTCGSLTSCGVFSFDCLSSCLFSGHVAYRVMTYDM